MFPRTFKDYQHSRLQVCFFGGGGGAARSPPSRCSFPPLFGKDVARPFHSHAQAEAERNAHVCLSHLCVYVCVWWILITDAKYENRHRVLQVSEIRGRHPRTHPSPPPSLPRALNVNRRAAILIIRRANRMNIISRGDSNQRERGRRGSPRGRRINTPHEARDSPCSALAYLEADVGPSGGARALSLRPRALCVPGASRGRFPTAGPGASSGGEGEMGAVALKTPFAP